MKTKAADVETPIPGSPWINVKDPASPALDAIGDKEGFHPLEIEDCRHRNQIAKISEHEDYFFIVIKTIHFDRAGCAIAFDDFDLFVKPPAVVTVQEKEDSSLVEKAVARMRKEHAQRPWRIVHALIDVAVDDYLPVLDSIGESIDELESDVLERPTPRTLQRALDLKRILIEFRRNATAMREVVNHLLRDAPRDRLVYMRDVYDHLVRVIDFIETYRDLVSGSLDIYLSSIANRTNDIVKVLTIYGTVALPLIVITGFYGMNLELPLQHSPHGLALVVALMAGSTAGIMWYFRRRGWL